VNSVSDIVDMLKAARSSSVYESICKKNDRLSADKIYLQTTKNMFGNSAKTDVHPLEMSPLTPQFGALRPSAAHFEPPMMTIPQEPLPMMSSLAGGGIMAQFSLGKILLVLIIVFVIYLIATQW